MTFPSGIPYRANFLISRDPPWPLMKSVITSHQKPMPVKVETVTIEATGDSSGCRSCRPAITEPAAVIKITARARSAPRIKATACHLLFLKPARVIAYRIRTISHSMCSLLCLRAQRLGGVGRPGVWRLSILRRQRGLYWLYRLHWLPSLRVLCCCGRGGIVLGKPSEVI